MIFSAQQLFSDNQAITATAISENVIDLGAPGTPPRAAAALNQDVGKGTPVPINVQVTEDFNNLTSLDVAIEVGATASLGTVVATQNILLADLVAGKTINLQCLPNGVDQRYLGLRYTVTGTAPTTGQIHAGITMGNQTNK
ncbi:MAG: hypothetical protein DBP02_02170 [gamma proteobacterium symbiont of Ctena orbiculata]|nr:MAG: hypothetical protein DBP02_02170 [gamma proteobacterium symbiont of Ctena orbiculata]